MNKDESLKQVIQMASEAYKSLPEWMHKIEAETRNNKTCSKDLTKKEKRFKRKIKR